VAAVGRSNPLESPLPAKIVQVFAARRIRHVCFNSEPILTPRPSPKARFELAIVSTLGFGGLIYLTYGAAQISAAKPRKLCGANAARFPKPVIFKALTIRTYRRRRQEFAPKQPKQGRLVLVRICAGVPRSAGFPRTLTHSRANVGVVENQATEDEFGGRGG
jgi:hypothetical protein